MKAVDRRLHVPCMGEERNTYKLQSENVKERDRMEDLYTEEVNIKVDRRDVQCRLDLSGSGHGLTAVLMITGSKYGLIGTEYLICLNE